jgi:hypothetical protein
MSKNRIKRVPVAKKSRRKVRIVAALTVVLSLFAAWTILANSREPASRQDGGILQIQSASPVLAKEYVYGPGGRLIASEQPNAISPNFKSFAGNGGAGTVTVTMPAGTNWTAVSNDTGWITVTSGWTGTGNGSVGYSVAANTQTSIRSGTITIAGQIFTVYQGKNFDDVLPSHPYYEYIGRLAARQVTLGCNSTIYCPTSIVTRQEMAAFIIRALGDLNPPTPQSQRFTDVPTSNIFYAFIEQMALRGITNGCGAGVYCPTSNVPHEQMATFIIRALHYSGYSPPTPQTQRFPDVPPSNIFYSFIDEYAARGIWNGGTDDWTGHPEGACTPSNYFCPSKGVSRAQMAKILVTAFNL